MAQDVCSPAADARTPFAIVRALSTADLSDTFDTPGAPDASETLPHAGGRPPPHRGERPKTVLLMDDAPEILTLVRQILEDDGHRVIASPRILEPEAIHALNPDLIVLELLFNHQPHGWDFLDGARRTPELRHIPILLLTGAAEQTRPHARELTARGVHVVPKPFDVEALLTMVRDRLTDRSPYPTPGRGAPTV